MTVSIDFKNFYTQLSSIFSKKRTISGCFATMRRMFKGMWRTQNKCAVWNVELLFLLVFRLLKLRFKYELNWQNTIKTRMFCQYNYYFIKLKIATRRFLETWQKSKIMTRSALKHWVKPSKTCKQAWKTHASAWLTPWLKEVNSLS